MLKEIVAIVARARGLGAMLLVVMGLAMGCGGWHSRHVSDPAFDLQVRPASGDTDRILRNASYYQLQGRTEPALKELEEAHQLDPKNLKVANTLAEHYEKLGRSARAQQIYQEALAQAPDHQVISNNLCFSYYQAGNWQQAEACFRQTLARQPNNIAARNNLGLLLCRQGRQEEARQLWQEGEGAAAAEQKLSQVQSSLALAPGGAAVPAGGPGVKGPAPEESRPVRTQTEPGSPGQVVAAAAGGAPPVSKTRPQVAPSPAPPATAANRERPPVKTAGPAAPKGDAAHSRPAAAKPEAAAAQAKPKAAALQKPAAPETGRSLPDPAARDRKPNPAPPAVTAVALAPTKEKMAPATRALTAEELMNTAIEVRNGNGIPDLAREVRSRLNLEGFNVVDIANHLDFGVDRTVVYYRPGSEQVARTLSAKFFPGARLECAQRLAEDIDVKILLGHDLGRPQTVAKGQEREKTL